MNPSIAVSAQRLGPRIGEVFVAGTVSALTAFPLSIGFSLLAGVPPAVMVLASIYSAIFNAVLAGRYGVGGPNTAVAMLTGTALMPFAPAESSLYMGYVFALCVLVGVYQLLFALMLRKVDFMDYVSTTVIDGITFGIGVVFVLTSLWMAAQEDDSELVRLIADEVATLNQSMTLPRRVAVRFEDCGEPNAFYDSTEDAITLCREYSEYMRELYDGG